jgi:hypothetical protein
MGGLRIPGRLPIPLFSKSVQRGYSMVIPAAMNIESAIPGLKQIEQRWRDDQIKELTCAVGASTATQLCISFPLSDEFKRGYELGLQTARGMIAGSVELMLKRANPENIL